MYFVNKTMVHMWLFCFNTSICWIHCIDQPKPFTLLLKSKMFDFETLSHVHVYCIEYVSNTYGIVKARIEHVSYWQPTVLSQPYKLWSVLILHNHLPVMECRNILHNIRIKNCQPCKFLRFHSTIVLNVFLFHSSEIKKGIQYRGELADHGSSWWAFSEAITGCLFFYMAIQTYRHTSHLFVSLFYFRIEKNNWTHSIL